MRVHSFIARALPMLPPLLALGCAPVGVPPDVVVEGRFDGRTYTSPSGLFDVSVPAMANPFVKQPSVVRDRRDPDGREEVTFSVPDLGEAWRFGARPLPSERNADAQTPEAQCDQELARWLNAAVKPNPVLDRPAELSGAPGVLRIYLQESASMLFAARGGGDARRERGLVGIVSARAPGGTHALYVVGQFDMPMHQLAFFVEDVGMEEAKAVGMLAEDHAARMLERAASLRLAR